jgi:hypothetical protein
MKAQIICEICREPIGYVETDQLEYPWTGEMFGSLYPEREVPGPFQAGVEWQYSRCPRGRHRPFIYDDRIYTDQGFYLIKEKQFTRETRPGDSDVFEMLWEETRDRIERENALSIPKCRKCGKTFGNAGARATHEKSCQGGVNGTVND